MSKIYLVCGISGEYEDIRKWIVKAFKEEDLAESFCKNLNKVCVENGLNSNETSDEPTESAKQNIRQHDPNAYWSYPGIDYYISNCEYEEN